MVENRCQNCLDIRHSKCEGCECRYCLNHPWWPDAVPATREERQKASYFAAMGFSSG